MERLRSEGGIALATAMCTLIVLGGLVSAVFFVSVVQQRLGLNALKVHGAFAAADGGVAEVVSQWGTSDYNQLAVGESAVLGQRWVTASAWYRGAVRRVNQQLFFITIDAFSQDSAARQGVGLLVRPEPIASGLTAALTVQGLVRLGAPAYLSGYDETPAGWNGCPAPQSSRPALRLAPADSATIQVGTCRDFSCLAGLPKILADTGTIDVFGMGPGTRAASDLASLATKILPGGTYSEIGPRLSVGACDRSHPRNWGDPLNPGGPCGRFFPFVFIRGNAAIEGGVGQGVLVVDGDLRVDGDLQFYGAVFVRGTLSVLGAGGRVIGGVVAGSADFGLVSVTGEAVVGYSSCALHRALTATAPAVPLGERAWMNLY